MSTILLYTFISILVCLVLFLLFFLRNPNRIPPPGDVILAPADGEVIEIGVKDNWIKIVIFMNLHNVHVQWAPYPGKVLSIEKFSGPADAAYLTEATNNRRVATTLETKIGKIIVIQIVGKLVRRILTFVKVGQEIDLGQRFGMILFGSRVELWLPADKVFVNVQKEEKVKAGVTIVAKPKELSFLSDYSKPYKQF
jgi:phosphatidylserine decarboxylase